ncbi:sodium/potassium-transporting ATPase subunit beta-1a [Nerophis ophidion]|uniref:sodium/potassium-transporting ATPase subunit beta-1a n=1 Tax=Nerophis ophidion TaxID=159077 RepID=UPI002ADF1FD9|nr:sodium/potassium-transporting ATPase subunit beta-1a [Nerophis ophidion]
MSGNNKEADGGWRTFVWNSEKKEFLGRTGVSWMKILLFYVIFYGFLAAIFVGTIQVMLLTLSNTKPTYQDRVAPPGLSHLPRSEKMEISFSMSDPKTYEKYVASMGKFLELYSDDVQDDPRTFEDCDDDSSYKERSIMENEVRKACRFRKSNLEVCAGLDDPSFGFSQGRPCIITKLNRIVNFRPQLPSTNALPESLANRTQPNAIPIFCTNKKEEDAGKVGEISYLGFNGHFPLRYYPYYGKQLHPHYLQPLVAIKFLNLTLNQEVRVECKVYGANIKYSEKDRYQGRFDIKFTIKS